MNAIPTPIQTLLDLFATQLADVRFADVDATTLGRFAADVEAAAQAVAVADAALAAARDELALRQDALLHNAQRALAYARVFAEHDEELSAKLEAVTLPRSPRKPRTEDALVLSAEPQAASRPRGRPRKTLIVATTAAPLLGDIVTAAE